MESVRVSVIIGSFLYFRLISYLFLGYVIYFPIIFYLCSTLSGSHGVPQVHYKGKQDGYYIMVCYWVLFFNHLGLIVF